MTNLQIFAAMMAALAVLQLIVGILLLYLRRKMQTQGSHIVTGQSVSSTHSGSIATLQARMTSLENTVSSMKRNLP